MLIFAVYANCMYKANSMYKVICISHCNELQSIHLFSPSPTMGKKYARLGSLALVWQSV